MTSTTRVALFTINNEPLFVKHIWLDDDQDLFHIRVFMYYEDETWSGRYSNEVAAYRRDRVGETEEEYAYNVRECLTGDNDEYVFNFVRSVEKPNAATFIWKRQFGDSLLVHGAVALRRDTIPESKEQLLQFILNQNKRLTKEIQHGCRENYKLIKDLDRCRVELQGYMQDTPNNMMHLPNCDFVQAQNNKNKNKKNKKKNQEQP